MHFWDEFTSRIEDPDILGELSSFYRAQDIPLELRYHCRELVDAQMVFRHPEFELSGEEFVRELERQFRTLPNFQRHHLSWFKKLLATKYKDKPDELLDRFHLCVGKEYELIDKEKTRLAELVSQRNGTSVNIKNESEYLTSVFSTQNHASQQVPVRRNDFIISCLKREAETLRNTVGRIKSVEFAQLHALRNAVDILPQDEATCQELEIKIREYGSPNYKLFFKLGALTKKFKSAQILGELEKDLDDWEFEWKRSFIGFPETIQLQDIKNTVRDVQTILSQIKSCAKELYEMQSLDRGDVFPSESLFSQFLADLDILQSQLFFIACRFEPSKAVGCSKDKKPILINQTRFPLKVANFAAIDPSIKVASVSVDILTETQAEFLNMRNLPNKTDPVVGILSGNKIPADPPVGRKIPKAKKASEPNVFVAKDSYLFVDFSFFQLTLHDSRRIGNPQAKRVTDDRYYLLVQFKFSLDAKEYHVWRVSTPIVICSHGTQECLAWGNIIWSYGVPNPTNLPLSRLINKEIEWEELLSVLDVFQHKFTGVHLGTIQRNHLTATATREKKLIQTYKELTKRHLDDERKFTFWDWFFNSLALVKSIPISMEHVHGFVSKRDATKLLKDKRSCTFLLRFSDSIPGALSVVTVGHRGEMILGIILSRATKKDDGQENKVVSVDSYIRNTANLVFLYPDIHKNTLEFRTKSEKKKATETKPWYRHFQPRFEIPNDKPFPCGHVLATDDMQKSQEPPIERQVTFGDFCETAAASRNSFSECGTVCLTPPNSEPESISMEYDTAIADFDLLHLKK